MRHFSLSILAFAAMASASTVASHAIAENISLRLSYSEGKNGLVFSPLHAETGQFALTPNQPAHAHKDHWRVVAKDAKGKVIHETTVKNGTTMHVESFNPKTGQIAHAETVRVNTGSFEVSLPYSSNVASVEVLPASISNATNNNAVNIQTSTAPMAKFDRAALQAIVSKAKLANISTLAVNATVTNIINNGPSSNHMDYVFVGDGYTAAEMSKWKTDAQKVIDGFMADPLFAANRSAMNVRRVDVASNQSGVDEIDKGIYKDTAMDGEFGCYNIDRLLCVNNTKVFNIVGSVLAPDARDVIVVVSNSTRYGGSGGSVATLSMNAQSTEVALHEIGHTAFSLADEYEYGTCDLSREPTEANVSKNSTRTVKWGSSIASNTQVPTSAGSYPNGTVGVFQGAQYCTSGKYRPTENSRMRTLGYPWHAVNEGLVRKVFAQYTGTTGGGGITQTGTLTQGGTTYAPSASPGYVQAGTGTFSMLLNGPSGTNFNLELYKWNGSSWAKVASSSTTGSTESIRYSGSAGYYYAKVISVTGSGTYTLQYDFPKP